MTRSESPLPPLSQRLRQLAAKEHPIDNAAAAAAHEAYMRAAEMAEEEEQLHAVDPALLQRFRELLRKGSPN